MGAGTDCDGLKEQSVGDLVGSQPVLGGVAPSGEENPLGQIEPNGGHVLGQRLSGLVRYRAGNQPGRKHMVEVWPRRDLVREVEPPGTPEAEVGQLPVLRAFRAYVELMKCTTR